MESGLTNHQLSEELDQQRGSRQTIAVRIGWGVQSFPSSLAFLGSLNGLCCIASASGFAEPLLRTIPPRVEEPTPPSRHDCAAGVVWLFWHLQLRSLT